MGPDATASFYGRLIELTPADQDQDHLHVIIDADPSVPDRTAAILGTGESPVPTLLAGVRRLVAAGSGLIAIPCNTAHVWLDDLRRAVDVPILDMIDETAAAAAAVLCPGASLVVLASSGLIKSQQYDRALEAHGLRARSPSNAVQEEVMRAIEQIKGGARDGPQETLLGIARRYEGEGADGIILGCTEIPLVLEAAAVDIPVFDSLDLLARRAVSAALGTHLEEP
jgi:aspartate racemase